MKGNPTTVEGLLNKWGLGGKMAKNTQLVVESATMTALRLRKTKVTRDAKEKIERIQHQCDADVKRLEAAMVAKKAAEESALETLLEVE
jgi:hypothetical protein